MGLVYLSRIFQVDGSASGKVRKAVTMICASVRVGPGAERADCRGTAEAARSERVWTDPRWGPDEAERDRMARACIGLRSRAGRTVFLYSISPGSSIFLTLKMTREKKRYTDATSARSQQYERAVESERAPHVGPGNRWAQHPSGPDGCRKALVTRISVPACLTPRFQSFPSQDIPIGRASGTASGSGLLSRPA